MNMDDQTNLNQEIQRELTGLPELRAPATLVPRVLSAIMRRAQVPWYRQQWQSWPLALRVASLGLSLTVVAAFSYGLWVLPHNPAVAENFQHLTAGFGWLSATWNVVSALGTAVVLALKQVNPGVLLGCLLLFGMLWATCVGLGSLCLRLAWARRRS